jgi:hypothetical protein
MDPAAPREALSDKLSGFTPGRLGVTRSFRPRVLGLLEDVGSARSLGLGARCCGEASLGFPAPLFHGAARFLLRMVGFDAGPIDLALTLRAADVGCGLPRNGERGHGNGDSDHAEH